MLMIKPTDEEPENETPQESVEVLQFKINVSSEYLLKNNQRNCSYQ